MIPADKLAAVFLYCAFICLLYNWWMYDNEKDPYDDK